MNTKPRIFLSAVSREFKTARTKVSHVLQFLGYETEQQEIFGTEPGDLRPMLRNKIDTCDGVLQIVGLAYGAEPPTTDSKLGRVSYTQFEFLYAREQRKKTWLLIAGEPATRDTPPEELDLPPEPAHSSPAAYQTERRALQAAYYNNLKEAEHARWTFASDIELENAVLKLRNDSQELRKEFRTWQKSVLTGIDDLSRRIAEIKAQPAPGAVAIDLGVPAQAATEPPWGYRSTLSRPFSVTYSVARNTTQLHISYVSPYLDAIRAEERVSMVPWAVGGTPYFTWNYPSISVKVTNPTRLPCYITEVLIRVRSSEVDTDPVLIAEGGFSGYVSIQNEGWGTIVDPVAVVQLDDLRGGFIDKQMPLTEYGSLDFSQCLSEEEYQNAERDGETRPFKASISYKTEGGAQQVFHCEGTAYFGPPPAPFVPPSREPYDVFLPAGKHGYETIVPVSQLVDAGGVDNFEIRVGTDRSATFELEFEFRVTSGESIGKTGVCLSAFVPRTGKVAGTTPTRRWRGLGETVVCGSVRLTLENVRLVRESEYREVFLAGFLVRNAGAKAVWFPANSSVAGGQAFVEVRRVSLEVGEGREHREESGHMAREGELAPLETGEVAPWDVRFAKPYGDFGSVLITMELSGEGALEEVAFRVPMTSIYSE